MRKFLLSFLATLVVFPALAQDQVAFELVTKGFWPNNSSYTDTKSSGEKKAGEVSWTMSNFNNNSNSTNWNNIRCGRKSNTSVAVIVNDSPISEVITKVVVTAMRAATGTPNSVKLYVSNDKNRDNAQVVTLNTALLPSSTTPVDLEFVISNPSDNQYYELVIDMPQMGGNGAIGINKLTFYKAEESNKTETSISFNQDSYSLTLGEDININDEFTPEFTVSPTDVDWGPLKFESSDSNVVEATDNKFIIKGAGTTTLSISFAGDDDFKPCSASCSLTVIDPNRFKRFERVTSNDDIQLGRQYVITSTDWASLSPNPNKSNGEISQVTGAISSVDGSSLTASSPIIVDTSAVAVFTIEEGASNYALKYSTGEYLTVNGTNTTSFNSGNDSKAASANVDITHGNTYDTFKFTSNNRIIYHTGSVFRSYSANGNTSNVYLYYLSVPKQEATLSWDKEDYTLDMDFGWEDGKPVLSVSSEEGVVDKDNVKLVYTSSNPEVATVSNAAESLGVITGKSVGDTEISVAIAADDKNYAAAESAKYTLHITAIDTPIFVDESGSELEGKSIELLPSELAAGYPIRIKKVDGYDLGVTIAPPAAGTVAFTDEGAVVTVKKACTISAATKKGEVSSKREVSFEVLEKELAPADIKWTAARYVFDMASSHWDNEPKLTNSNSFPVTYNSSDPAVATISETGKVTPLKQGSTIISAAFDGSDYFGAITVTAMVRVTDSNAPAGYDIFEMVKKGDQLSENEQFIIVSGERFNPEASVGELTNVGGLYYALSPYRFNDTSELKDYYEAIAVEFPEGDDSGERLMVKDDSYVLRLNKQFDTSGANPDYPFLFQVMNEDIDINDDGEILDTDNPTHASGNNERIYQRYIQVKKAKLFSFVDLPENIEDRGMMNGNIRVLDPKEIEGYSEEDYINIKHTSQDNYSGEKGSFIDKAEIIFNNSADGKQYFVRFNPAGKAVHFNVYAIDNNYDTATRSKSGTYPIRIYRRADRVEKPSITVYPEEPVASDIAYENGQTYNNKVRVVIEQHPKTSENADLMRQWQAAGKNPALPDYDKFPEDIITVFVDGNEVVDENDRHIRYIDGTRTLFAVSRLDDVYSESASATFNFKTAAPRITNPTKGENGVTVRISRPANYTKDAIYFYVVSENGEQPSVVFDQDGTISSENGTMIDAWSGNADDTTSGIVTIPEGNTLWVGAFKSGYTPSLVEYNSLTAFPECRPMQLLRLTDAGRAKLLEDFDTDLIFDHYYDATKPLYINYRNDLVNEEDGSISDSEHHYHYMIQRNHEYAVETGRKVWIEQISENQFRKIFGDDNLNVDDDHAKYFEWTSDFYVFALNEDEFYSYFENREDVAFESPKIVAPDRTYTALENTFTRKPTNPDGSYKQGAEEEVVTYYGAMMENQGKLGAKALTTQLTYLAGDDAKEFTTEATAEVAPRIPSVYGFSYEYQYEREEEPSLKEENPDCDFVKISVPSAIDGKDNSDALIPIDELNSRHLNLIFKFHRPNISKHILENYDLYYNIKFNRIEEIEGEDGNVEFRRTLLAGSGVYMDTEKETNESDAIYRFRIDDVNPTAKIYPEIEISKVTYVGNSGADGLGQYVSNFGEQKMTAPAPNNAERTETNIKELLIVKDSEREIDGKMYADWKYIGHSEFDYKPDIIVKNPNSDDPVYISSSFFRIESYLPGTDYYQAYEYLVKHDDNSHIKPTDENHPYLSDEEYGHLDYDALRHTIIARNVPADEEGNLKAPKVVISPVYFFAYGADMKPLSIADDDNVIPDYTNAGGEARIVKVNDLPGAVSPTGQDAARAPRRADASEKVAPSSSNYPMPHAGDTDMAHNSILDLSNASNFTVVYGGSYQSEEKTPNIVIEWGDYKTIYKKGDETSIGISTYDLNGNYVEEAAQYIEIISDNEYVQSSYEDEEVTLKFLKTIPSTKIIARLKPNVDGFLAEESAIEVHVLDVPELKFVVNGATEIEDLSSTWDPKDENFFNNNYYITVDLNKELEFKCEKAKKLKVDFFVGDYHLWDGTPSESLLIEQNSFSIKAYSELYGGYIVVTPIAEGYTDNGVREDEHLYTEQRYCGQIQIDNYLGEQSTILVLDLNSTADTNSKNSFTFYSGKESQTGVAVDIAKRDEDEGKLTQSSAGLTFAGNGDEDDLTPISYDIDVRFSDPERAETDGFNITDVRLQLNPQEDEDVKQHLSVKETTEDFKFSGNSWYAEEQYNWVDDSYISAAGWVGYNSNVKLTANTPVESTVPQIKVAISHPVIERPVWERDYTYEDDSYVRGWIRHKDSDHEVYYRIHSYGFNAPERIISDSYDYHDEIIKNGTKSDGQTPITLRKNSYIETFAVHPLGARSDIRNIDQDNLVTGINGNVITDDAEERWYNIQGVEVKNPAEGVYIRVKNGKSEKVVIK